MFESPPYITFLEVKYAINCAHGRDPEDITRWKSVRNTWSWIDGEGNSWTRYQKTDICHIDKGGILHLHPEGYHTPTTKQRLNVVMNKHSRWMHASIYQRNHEWYISAFYRNGTKCHIEFEEGMRLNTESELIDYQQPAPRLGQSQFSQGVLLDPELMR